MIKRIAKALASYPLVVSIKFYQWIVSPIIPTNCRFAPSCSHYALDAIATHGPIRGLILSIKRILRCHPWGDSGFDPVPEKKTFETRKKWNNVT
ncbi:MAG: membrane protein insertion efficiency factor YidD [Rhodospirillaceae bacterium]